jgi:hypothetical protein
MTAATTHQATAEGEHLKLAAFALLAASREALIRRARRALLAVLLDRGEATIDDVRVAVPVPDGINPKAFGPVPGELAEAGIIAAHGYAKSTRPEAHARPVQVWRLADRAAALHWLAMHPDLPEPEPADLGDQFNNKMPGAGTPGEYERS